MNCETKGNLTYEGDQPKRLDLFLAESLPLFSRSQIQQSIEHGLITVNSIVRKSKYKLKAGEHVSFEIIDNEIDLDDILPEAIPLDVIYEDEDVVVLDKQANLSSHPTPNQRSGTLVNALLHHYSEINKAVYDPESKKSRVRAGIVHRLDKDTTGAMIVAKNASALRLLSDQIKHRQANKHYIGLCLGDIGTSGKLINFLGRDPSNRKRFTEVGESKGKIAITRYELLTQYHFKNTTISMASFQIETGRTHQIRAQMLLKGNPLIGDSLYNTPESLKISSVLGAKRQMLHSKQLQIQLPSQKKLSTFVADTPSDMQNVINRLE